MKSNPLKTATKVPPMLVTAAVADGQSVEFSAMTKLRAVGSWPLWEVGRQGIVNQLVTGQFIGGTLEEPSSLNSNQAQKSKTTKVVQI